jgi:(2Fe-2S) ferredoxin
MTYFQHHVFCCTNRREAGSSRGCCAEKQSEALQDYFKQQVKSLQLQGKGKIRINKAGCLDRCEFGAVVVVYPSAIWYSIRTEQDVDAILHEHLIGGVVVERLRIKS